MGEEHVSRSSKKRESSALQVLGKRLAALSPALLRDCPMAPELLEAITQWQGMTDHEAKRRQMQYIGRLMRAEESEQLAAFLDRALLPSREETTALHRIEEARERLLAAAARNHADTELERELSALGAPPEDLPRLRHLVRGAVAERTANKPPKAFRELFRALKALAAARPGGRQ